MRRLLAIASRGARGPLRGDGRLSVTRTPRTRLSVVVEPLPARGELGERWRALERRAAAPCVLTWNWIDAWLTATGATPCLVRVEEEGRAIGLALVCVAPGGLLRPMNVHLHETGSRLIDRLSVEYNGFLAVAGREDEVHRAALDALPVLLAGPGRGPQRLRLRVSAAGASLAAALITKGARVQSVHPAPFVDLEAVRAEGDYLALLSANTRQQIRRAMRRYERDGPLRLRRAADRAEAHAMIAALAPLHEARFEKKGEAGGFANPAFRPFLEALAARGVAEGSLDLLELAAGARVIGYLVNLRAGGWVFNYTSGFAYAPEAVEKPGLVAHALAIAAAAGQRLQRYSFLAGASRYKTSLATGADTLAWLTADLG